MISGDDGTAAIEWAAGEIVHRLGFITRAQKFVPIHVLWTDERHPLSLSRAKELRLEPGTTIGGIIHDESGRPVQGVTIDVHAPPTEYEGSNYFFGLGSPITDTQGRWRLDEAPKDLARVWGRTSHPHYRDSDVVVSRNLDSVVVIKKGLSVAGRVVDAAGRPIVGARVIMGHDTWGTNPPTGSTNEQGEFTLENAIAGPTIITVQAEGFAPRIQDVLVTERTASVEFRMEEPASVLRCRIVDVKGNPVAGTHVFADTWRGHRSINFRAQTDRDGRFEWRSAPKDAVLYDFLKEGFMRGRLTPLTPSDREQTIILYPKLVIAGRVTDAATGRPLPKFRVVKGWKSEWQDAIRWFENMGLEVAGDRYSTSFDSPAEALLVKVEAPGYKPAQSRSFQPNEGSQIFDFKLERAAELSGIVVLPDGTPAPAAEVVLATEHNRVQLRAGRIDRDANCPKVATGPQGRFTFPEQQGPFLLIALSDFGYAEASADQFAKSEKLILQPWGKIDGGGTNRSTFRVGANGGIPSEPA